MTLYLSRLTLDRAAGNAALMPLLDPESPAQALDAHHRLLWTLFADGPDRRRDFLWRTEGAGRFFVLSFRPPAAHPLFLPPEVKEFAPALAPGDRLAFVLRANATKDRAAISRLAPEERRGKSRRVDLVMDLLHTVPKSARAEERFRLADQAAREWLARQGTAHGFAPEGITLHDYSVTPLPRQSGPRAGQARLGILDIAGTLIVTDPATFTARLGKGFGRARAFGCGLMLIRRA